jgi:aryl carrier-like protein
MMSGAGQVDYCAASSFQDAFAHAEQGRLARRVVSIDWAAWREIGKAFRSAVERGASPDDALPNGMSPAEGFDALVRALSSSAPQVLVSPESIEVLKRRRAASDAPGVAAAPAAAGNDREAAPASEPEAGGVEGIIAGIWREVLGVRDVGADANFFDLGGDSLMSLQFIAKAKQAGFRLTNSQVFEHQTVAALAAVAVPLGRDARSSVS